MKFVCNMCIKSIPCVLMIEGEGFDIPNFCPYFNKVVKWKGVKE